VTQHRIVVAIPVLLDAINPNRETMISEIYASRMPTIRPLGIPRVDEKLLET
jgi:hypothetical protein